MIILAVHLDINCLSAHLGNSQRSKGLIAVLITLSQVSFLFNWTLTQSPWPGIVMFYGLLLVIPIIGLSTSRGTYAYASWTRYVRALHPIAAVMGFMLASVDQRPANYALYLFFAIILSSISYSAFTSPTAVEAVGLADQIDEEIAKAAEHWVFRPSGKSIQEMRNHSFKVRLAKLESQRLDESS